MTSQTLAASIGHHYAGGRPHGGSVMAKKFTTLLAPVTAAMAHAKSVEGWRTSGASRFAVVRDGQFWRLIHIKSGMPVDAALPAVRRKLARADKLAVIAAWEADPSMSWAAFDALLTLGVDTGACQKLALPDRDTFDKMRAHARAVLA